MSIIELGALGEFVGAIAVVATLAYLALQVRQSKLATLASTEFAKDELTIRSLQADRDSPYMGPLSAKAASGEDFDEADRYRATKTIIILVVRLRSDYDQRRTLGLDLPARAGFAGLRGALTTFGEPVRTVWAQSRAMYEKDFLDWVESNVEGLTETGDQQ
jgi:hypothetical protein